MAKFVTVLFRTLVLSAIYYGIFIGFDYLLIVLTLSSFDFNDGKTNMLLIIAFGLVIMNFMLLYLIHDIIIREKVIHKSGVKQERIKSQESIYCNMHNIYEHQRKKNHDYKNHLICIQGMLANGKVKETQEYIADLSGSLIKDLDTIHTNHAVVDAVLSQKYRYAQNRGITFIYVVNDLSELIIREEDLVIVLSNILDNAIEACEKVEADNKIIKFKMSIDKDQLIISAQNPLKIPLQIIDSKIVTNKKNKVEHGLGLVNIKAVIDSYNGTFAIKCKDGWFCLSVLIPFK